MADRGAFRGRGGSAHRGGGYGQHRGGGNARGGNQTHNGADQQKERPKRESIVDLSKYMDKEICVKFSGGREVTGMLKGYDQLMNLVLDDVKEVMRGECRALPARHLDTPANLCPDDEGNQTTRSLGLIVARGTLLVLVSPVDGSEEIANPFAPAEE
ncbi:Sm-like protein lsm7 [Ascosphaera atra]|nr:Sm-like protein lsm7 [Ascosphaera atra]